MQPLLSHLRSPASQRRMDTRVSGTACPVKNGFNDLCWRDGFWTPATGLQGCGWRSMPMAAPARLRCPRRPRAPARPAPGPARLPAAAVPAPTSEKVTLLADAFFDFDKAVLKPEGRASARRSGAQDERPQPGSHHRRHGHTDAVGSDAYNQSLSVRRSEAVKGYLVSKGVEKNRVYTEGSRGEKQPVADNKTAEGRAKNRRVEIRSGPVRAVVRRSRGITTLRFSEAGPLTGIFRSSYRGPHSDPEPYRTIGPRSTPTRRSRPSFPSSPTAGGTRTASSGRCTRSTRCASKLDRSARGVAGKACSTSVAAAASWPKRWRAAAPPSRHRPRSEAAQGRRTARDRSAKASNTAVSVEALADETRGSIRRRHLHGIARARSRSGVGRSGLRPTGAGPSGWVFFSTINRNAKASRSRSSAPSTC